MYKITASLQAHDRKLGEAIQTWRRRRLLEVVVLVDGLGDVPGAAHALGEDDKVPRGDLHELLAVTVGVHLHLPLQQVAGLLGGVGPRELALLAPPRGPLADAELGEAGLWRVALHLDTQLLRRHRLRGRPHRHRPESPPTGGCPRCAAGEGAEAEAAGAAELDRGGHHWARHPRLGIKHAPGSGWAFARDS